MQIMEGNVFHLWRCKAPADNELMTKQNVHIGVCIGVTCWFRPSFEDGCYVPNICSLQIGMLKS